jgi:exosortase/archaeosortase family protein
MAGDVFSRSLTLSRRSASRHSPSAGRHAGNGLRAAIVRIIATALLAAVVSCLLAFEYQARHIEAVVAAHLFSTVTPVIAAGSAPIDWFNLGTSKGFGLVITPDCSSALLLVPLGVIGMALLIPRRLAVRRVGAGLAAAAAVIVVGNLLRIAVIAAMVNYYGIHVGYQVGHLVLGSLVSIVFIGVAMVVLVLVVAGPGSALARRAHRHRRRGLAA